MTQPYLPIQQRRLLAVFFVLIFVLFVYTFLHEAGHAAVGLFFGGNLYSFSLNFFNFSAHVGLSGSFDPFQRSLINLAGMSLPVLVWAFFLLITPRIANPILELLKTIGSAGLLGSLLPWILIPLVYHGGIAPAGDDVTQFLNNSRAHPLLVSAFFVGVFLAGARFFISRSSLGQVLDWLRMPLEEDHSSGIWCTLTAMIAVLVLLGVMGVSMHSFLY